VSSPAPILLVEDDQRLGALLVDYLRAAGLPVEWLTRGDEAAERVLRAPPALLILDLMLPGLDGLSVCQRVRGRYAGPILMLTARAADADQVACLEAGADDYVIKPCKPAVLLARVRALLRRAGAPADEEAVRVGPLRIDRGAREVIIGEAPLELTTTEFELLWSLARSAGRVVSRDELYLQVRGISYDGEDRGMDIHVSRLRKKLSALELAPQIKSVRGEGYQLAARPVG